MAKRRMVRKQLYIQSEQDDKLKEKANKYNISEGEVVRAALDKYLTASEAAFASFDINAWKEELAFISKRMKDKPSSKGGRNWKRDDLYGR